MSKQNKLRIYFDDHVLLLTEESISLPGFQMADHRKDLTEIIREFEQPGDAGDVIFQTDSIKKSLEYFLQEYTLIEAGGGWVKNPAGESLFIFRLGKWDLPKGKMEKNESPAECAVREVKEECGVKKLMVTSSLPPTFHTYRHKGKRLLKKTHWFEMLCHDWKSMKPQEEENISEVRWMTTKEINNTALKSTYRSIADLITETL
jgi:ADP-ribose pyrophosphatase YjhB (NUDIX family)